MHAPNRRNRWNVQRNAINIADAEQRGLQIPATLATGHGTVAIRRRGIAEMNARLSS